MGAMLAAPTAARGVPLALLCLSPQGREGQNRDGKGRKKPKKGRLEQRRESVPLAELCSSHPGGSPAVLVVFLCSSTKPFFGGEKDLRMFRLLKRQPLGHTVLAVFIKRHWDLSQTGAFSPNPPAPVGGGAGGRAGAQTSARSKAGAEELSVLSPARATGLRVVI